MNTDYSKIFLKPENSKTRKHADFLPNNIFMVIAGSTGCGKTNLLLNFLLKGHVSYGDVYIYTSTGHQDAYKYLKERYAIFEEILKNSGISHKIIHFFDCDDDIKDPAELDPNANHVMVFDDVMNADQTKIKDYFCRGRHNNVNVFYLCQSLHKLKKHCIRDNANIFILFHQDDKTLKYFYETHISGDMSFEEFKKFCHDAWSRKYGYVVINIWEEAHCGRYVQNYDTIYIPEKYLKITTK